jgi:hypothetical protein
MNNKRKMEKKKKELTSLKPRSPSPAELSSKIIVKNFRKSPNVWK